MRKNKLSSVFVLCVLVLASACNLNRGGATAPTRTPAPTKAQASPVPTDAGAAAAPTETPAAPAATAESSPIAGEVVTGTVEGTPQATAEGTATEAATEPAAGATAVPTDTAAAGATPEATATTETTSTATIQADATDVLYVVARGIVNVRSGPGTGYRRISRLVARQVAPVTGVSTDKGWWRIGCEDGAAGDCWAVADQRLLQTADAIPVVETAVKYVLARGNVNMRSGPGTLFKVIGDVKAGQTVQVTGLSGDRRWWQVVCPDGSTGDCWISADARLTQRTTVPQ
jgi:uncharacterized protein YraI